MKVKPDFWTGEERVCWLCVLMENFLGVQSLKNIPLILSGMQSIYNAPQIKSSAQAIFNLREIALDLVTDNSVKKAIDIYNDYHYSNNTEGVYIINSETLTFERKDFLEDPLIIKAKQILSQPLTYSKHSQLLANPSQAMAVALGEVKTGIRIPIEPITAPLKPRQTHQLQRPPQGKITIPLRDLKTLAIEMDEKEKNFPERIPGNWENRLAFDLMTTETNEKLEITETLELENIKHLLGLPGAGKTTLLMLIAMWLGKKDYKALFLFPSIEVARQYLTQLAFHQIKVGMLVGNSEQTRRRHADNLAEAIAITGENGGFACTMEGAELFGLNCVLPAFTKQDISQWGFGEVFCTEILQGINKNGQMKKCLCPLWTMCGRNQTARDLIEANIWVGHVISMDTNIPTHAINEEIRYFELIARSFDLVVFDEADMVQSLLDSYGIATLNISGAKNSIHQVISQAIHNRFARGENYRLFDRNIELYSRDLSEFGDHNTSLITTVQNLSSSAIGHRYENQLLTVWGIIRDLGDGLETNYSPLEQLSEEEIKKIGKKNYILSAFWLDAGYTAFYHRTDNENLVLKQASLAADTLNITEENLKKEWIKLVNYFRRYLAENLIYRRDEIIKDLTNLFLNICFADREKPAGAEDVIKLLVCITFMILGYQRIVPGTKTMVAEGLIKDSIITPTPSTAMQIVVAENILGSFSGVKYSLSSANTSRKNAQNVKLSYITLVSAPRILMHRFHQLFMGENQQQGPAVLMTSATSFLEASPAYHIKSGPHYLLKPHKNQHSSDSQYSFLCLRDKERGDQPLRYSGGGELRNRNLEKMVESLVKDGEKSHIYKSIKNFDIQHNIYRKCALVVNSYEQARNIKKYLDNYYPEIGKKTQAIVKYLQEGEKNNDYITTAQCPLIGDDENCDILIFPMLAIGRGVNIVFTQGERNKDAAIGSIYFLTRPHPNQDDLGLLYSLIGEATQDFDSRIFTENDDLDSLVKAWEDARKSMWKKANRLLREPLMASRLSPTLFKAFTANMIIDILQTIGRGMRNNCPVQVFFVDAAWSPQSAQGKTDSARYSMLVQMRVILEEAVNHSDPIKRQIYQELYGAFLRPLQRIKGVNYPDDFTPINYDQDDDFDDFDYSLEM